MSTGVSQRGRIRILLGAGLLLISGTAAISHLAQPRDPAPVALAHKSVSYRGHDFVVPTSWPVIDLTAHPNTCVRFDVHALYLGVPGAREDCAAQGVGRRTEAILVQPAGAASRPSVDHLASQEIDVSDGGVAVNATYGANRAQTLRILAAANLAPPVEVKPRVPARGAVRLSPQSRRPLRADAAETRQPLVTPPGGTVGPSQLAQSSYVAAGLGFDSCTAPSRSAMQAWGLSPFNVIGIYVGGSDRACAQPSLTSTWITATARAGWKFMPIYVGPQAAFGELNAPATQAVESADDAIAQVTSLGFGPGTLIYYDMEGYSGAQSSAAMAFVSAWDTELAAKGYRSAVYSSESSGITDLVAHLGKIVEPTVVSIAQWNGVADTDPGATPAADWPNLRVHQFVGGSLPGGGPDSPTYGGITINIDQDFLAVDAP
jgi:hypothetical protein